MQPVEERPERPVRILGRALEPDELLVIAGPCILEGEGMALEIASTLAGLAGAHRFRLIFKASYRKANRSSVHSYTGPGDEEALRILGRVRAEVGVPVLTDIHGPGEAALAADVCDCIQIPAFLSRQTELLQAAARTGCAVNVKKGQFLAPDDMPRVVEKIRHVRPDAEVWLTERGATFGYHNLVVDMRVFPLLRPLGVPLIYDATHSLQHPGVGGDRRHARALARAAIAAGADGLFLETHPDPPRALSDSTTQLPLGGLGPFLEEMADWKRLQGKWIDRRDTVAGEEDG